MPNQMLINDGAVENLREAIGDGKAGLSMVPMIIKRVIREEMWKRRSIKRLHGTEATFARFEDFVVTAPLEGLGSTVEQLRKLCHEDPEARDLIDRACQGKHGGDHRSQDAQSNVDNVHVDRPSGNTESAALRRLRKDREDLHTRVLQGELSAHAAMVEAGYRKKKVQIELEPQAAARIIQKHFDAERGHQLIEHLQELYSTVK